MNEQNTNLFNFPHTAKNRLFVRKISEVAQLIEHSQQFSKYLPADGVPYTSKNRHTVVCSTIFALAKNSLRESSHLISGKNW
jgi:hypothetical protein